MSAGEYDNEDRINTEKAFEKAVLEFNDTYVRHLVKTYDKLELVNHKFPNTGESALHIAVKETNEKSTIIAKFLIQKKANVCHKNKNNFLHILICCVASLCVCLFFLRCFFFSNKPRKRAKKRN